MKLVHKIDTTGLFLEDVVIQDNEVTPSDCIDTQPVGFYKPKWDFTAKQWVEGEDKIDEILAEKAKAKALQEAKDYLASTDHKVLPSYVPDVDEDVTSIVTKRNEVREFIRGSK